MTFFPCKLRFRRLLAETAMGQYRILKTRHARTRRFDLVSCVLLAVFVVCLLKVTDCSLCLAGSADDASVQLPDGVKAVWDFGKASREKTATRDRVCLNGLWQWQPVEDATDTVPTERWGYFKVPGCWPGITDYLQKDCQTVYAHPAWKSESLGDIKAAWYQREITVPGEWARRRLVLRSDYLNSYAAVYVDGKRMGEMRFPGGSLDVTEACQTPGRHVLSLLVIAMPLKGVMLSYNDTSSAKQVKGSVHRRGLCGDVWLEAEPQGARIGDVKVDTSVHKWEVTFDAPLEGLSADLQYALCARITNNGRVVREFTGKPFKKDDLKDGRIAFTGKWKPDKLWDLDTPENTYQVSLSLLTAGGKVLDVALASRFGFREFWIDGRDFYLNGSRIFLSAVPEDNSQVGAAWATYDAAKESMKRLKSVGVNLVFTHSYGCEPGSHLSFAEVLRAADDVGMLVSLSQPHFGHYDWKAADADESNGYARHAEFYVRAAGNHPSVVFYSMSHNATGYAEDINPEMIDGHEVKRDRWAMNNVTLALRAEAIVHRLDPERIIYHHSSGNLSAMYTVNFYPNFAPIQELSEWFGHWAAEGTKPLFTCEYGAPCTWDWTMYRGWYKGERSFGSAAVPWEFCFAEWNAQFLGDRAFQICEAEKANLRWETKQFREGRLWHRWDYPYEVGSRAFDDRFEVMSQYITENTRANRTWGLSGNNFWEYGFFWKLREGKASRQREDLKVDWENLQRPGYSPDYVEDRYDRMDLGYQLADWIPTAAARALVRNNGPVLAYIAGKPARFTSKDHNFLPGQSVEKQIIVINNSRRSVTCECEWSLGLPHPVAASKTVSIETGDQIRIPLRFDLPEGLRPGRNDLTLKAKFSNGETQEDTFVIDVLAPPSSPKSAARIALLDPKGETGQLLRGLGVVCESVEPEADLSKFDVLIVGKGALTVSGPGPELSRVRDGMKVVVFEQSSEVLEKRLGFRTAEYGLRQVFERVPDHPLLAGIDAGQFRDWRGEATSLPSRLKYQIGPRYAPTVKWCDIDVTRVWRCGNYGSVASVLIEKPVRGNFLPVLDGGFSLQYSPLMEFREGKGMILFCQVDVTGRTENEPTAERLVSNIIDYVDHWKSSQSSNRRVVYAGDPVGEAYLKKAGVVLDTPKGEGLSSDEVLVIGPGGAQKLPVNAANVSDWVKLGGRVLALGMNEVDSDAILPGSVRMKKAEHIAAFFEPPGMNSPLAGIGPADVHNRDPREFSLVTGGGATVLGDGVLATADNANLVFDQLVPWEFDYAKRYNLKRTYRRAAFVLARILSGMGVSGSTPILDRFKMPCETSKPEGRWLDGLYLDQPEEMDDPYRFFGW